MDGEGRIARGKERRAKVFICRNWFPEELQRVAQVHDTRIGTEEGNPPRPVLLEAVREIDGLICLGSDEMDAEVIRGPGGRKLSVASAPG